MRHVALQVHLTFVSFRWRWERDHSEHARTHAHVDRFYRAAVAGARSALEDDGHLDARGPHPLLQLDELRVEARELFLVRLALERASRVAGVVGPARARLSRHAVGPPS